VAAECPDEPYVYAARYPRTCFLSPHLSVQTINIYVASGSVTDVTGVSFRLQTTRFGPADVQSITTPWDVSITSGDIFSGINLIFSSRHLDHDPVLTIEVSVANNYAEVVTQNVYLYRGSVPEPVAPFVTVSEFAGCVGPQPMWYPPAEVELDVDQDDSFCFRAVAETNSDETTGWVEVIDPLGWVPDGFQQQVYAGCGAARCSFNYTAVTVPVHVPSGVPDGTTNVVTVHARVPIGIVAETTITLRAVDPIATRETTWGLIKALYREAD
jgi:hypothetical protein